MRINRMKILKFNALFFFFLGFITTSAFSDIVYLKNENCIEGIVDKEDENKVTLNIGYGKIVLNKKDIKYIYRYNPQQQDELRKKWSYKYFTRPEFIPPYLQDIVIEFNNLENLRNTAIESRKKKDEAMKKNRDLDEELKKLNAKLSSISDILTRIKPEDNLQKYNSTVEEFNSLLARIKLTEYNKDMLQKQIASSEQEISVYINYFGIFRKRFRELCATLREEVKEQNKYFFEGVNKKLNEMDSDFTRHMIGYNRYGSSIIVETLLNDSVTANLIVDTGSSLVIISKQVADRLELDMSQKPPILITLADGRKVNASSVILETVKVEDVEVKNVQAAILGNKESTEVDGLLGMSFLENFLVSIDAKGNRLILEEFNPN